MGGPRPGKMPREPEKAPLEEEAEAQEVDLRERISHDQLGEGRDVVLRALGLIDDVLGDAAGGLVGDGLAVVGGGHDRFAWDGDLDAEGEAQGETGVEDPEASREDRTFKRAFG